MNDDLISRAAAIEVIDAVFPVDPMKSEYAQGIACGAALAKTYVEQLPSAQPETAKRIVGKSKDGMTLWYQCDMCNEPVDAQDNFCRGCGRRLTDG
jgi:hypothetical protein